MSYAKIALVVFACGLIGIAGIVLQARAANPGEKGIKKENR